MQNDDARNGPVDGNGHGDVHVGQLERDLEMFAQLLDDARGRVTSRNGNGGVAVKEKVRGMNASLMAHDGPLPALIEVRHAHSPRQFIAALLIALIALAAAAGTVAAVLNRATSFSGVVAASHRADLNFPTTARLVELNVRPGDTVSVGQILARQDDRVAAANLAAAKAIAAANEAKLANLQSPQLTDAQRNQFALLMQQAQTAVNNSYQAVANARNVANGAVSAAESVVASDQSVVAADQTRLAADCPNGAVPPVPGSSTFAAAQQLFLHCSGMQTQLSRDTAALNNAQSSLNLERARAQQIQDQASASVRATTSSLAVTQNVQALQTAPGTPVQIAQANADLAQANAQVVVGQQLLEQLMIRSPVDGTVAVVNGIVGDLVGESGVRDFAGPQSVAPVGPSFSLFPAPAQAAAAPVVNSFSPLISVNESGPMQAKVEVPESAIGKLRPGDKAQLTINALNQSAPATVGSIIADPVRSSGQVTFVVTYLVSRWPTGIIPGMTVSVIPGG
jgi:multidrug efflux pump subunit AcrA (membrane-fusion protein)